MSYGQQHSSNNVALAAADILEACEKFIVKLVAHFLYGVENLDPLVAPID
jgi:hypothetical protein